MQRLTAPKKRPTRGHLFLEASEQFQQEFHRYDFYFFDR